MTYLDITSIIPKIPTYLNVGLIGLTLLIFITLLLCYLRGLLRGWLKGTYHLLFMVGLFCLAYFTLDPLVEFLRGFDLSSFGIPDVAFTINEQQLVLHVTTVDKTVRDAIEIILTDGFNVHADPALISNYALAVATSVIKWVLVITETLLILIVGNLLAFGLWHLIFKWIFGRPKLKHPVRWLSGVQNLAVSAVIMALMIAPLSSMVNTVMDNADIDASHNQNEWISLAAQVTDAYENSLWNRTFFSWTRPDGQETIDARLMNFLTESKIGETSFSLLNELGAITNAGAQAANLYFGNSYEDGIAWKALLTSTEEITTIIDALGKTSLYQSAMPFAIKLAVNFEAVVEYIGEHASSDINEMDIDVANEIDIVKEMYVLAVESGVFDIISDEHSAAPIPIFDDIYSIIFNETFHEKLRAITLDLDRMAVFNRIVTGFLYTFASKEDQAKNDDPATPQLIDLLPLKYDEEVSNYVIDEEKMLEYKWGEELITALDPLFYIHDANPEGFKNLFDIITDQFLPSSDSSSEEAVVRHNAVKAEGEESSTAPETSEGGSGDENTSKIVKAVLSLVADTSEAIVTAIVGNRDANGNPITDEDKGKNLGDNCCLMDSVLITNFMNCVPDLLGNVITNIGEDMDPVDMTDAKEVLFADTSEKGIRIAFKRELGAILDVVQKTISTPEGKEFLVNYDSHPGIDFDPDGQFMGIEKGLVKGLQAGLRSIDKSEMLTAILPPLADHFIGQADILSSIGIDHLYLYDGNLGNELADLLDLFIYCPDFVSFAGTMAGNSSMDRITAMLSDDDIADQLVHAVDLLGNCDLINPESENNAPIYNLVMNLVPENEFISFTEEDFQIDNLFCTYDADGHRTSNGETYYLVRAITILMNSGLMDMMGGSTSTDDMIPALARVDLPGLFEAIGGSRLLRKAVAGGLDTLIIENMLNPADVGVQGISFTNLNVGTDEQILAHWASEGQALADIVELANRGMNLSNLNFFGADGAKLLDLFKKFADSGIFMERTLDEEQNVQENYLFPTYFYNMIINKLDGSALQYFADQGHRADLANETEDIEQYLTTLKNNCLALNQPSDWSSDEGQIELFKRIIVSMDTLGGMSGIGNIDASTAPHLREILLTLADSDVFGNLIIPNGLEEALGGISSGDLSFNNANTDYLWTLNDTTQYTRQEAKAARIAEIEAICQVIETIFDPYYGLFDEEGNLDTSGMNVVTLSSDHFLKPVLFGCRDSHIFFDPKDPNELSIFERMIATFVKESGILGEVDNIDDPMSSFLDDHGKHKAPAYCDYSVAEVIRAVPDDAWDDEINKLCDMLNLAKQTVFVDPIVKNIVFDPIKDPAAFYASDVSGKNEQDLRDLMDLINDSLIFYRALPFHLDMAFDSMSGFASAGGLAEDIGFADPYFRTYNTATTGTPVYDYLPYEDSDMETLLDVLKTFGTQSGVDMSDITTLDADGVTELIYQIGRCPMFNQYNDITAKTGTSSTVAKHGLTPFECVIADFLSIDALSEYYYQANSPKDTAYREDGLYNSSFTKAIYAATHEFKRVDEGYGEVEEALLKGDEGSLKCVLAALTSPALSSIVTSGNFNVDDLSYDTFLAFLLPINDCKLTMDIVPNLIYSMVLNNSTFSINIAGVNFDRSNFYFSYWWYEEENSPFQYHSEPDFSQKFYEPELEQMASIVSFLAANKDGINSLGSFNLNNVDPYLIRDLLVELESSYCFHYAGPDNRDGISYSTNYYLIGTLKEGGHEEFAPLSVFHQLMLKLYVDSKLANMAYDSTYDLAYFIKYDASGSGNYLEDSGARKKVYDRILSFESGNLATSHSGDWIAEIEAFTTDGRRHNGYSLSDSDVGLIETIKSLNSELSSTTMSLTADQFRKLSPAQIRWLLLGINHIDIICDALPYSSRSLITSGNGSSSGLGVQRYTTDSTVYANNSRSWTLPNDFILDEMYAQPTSISFAYAGADNHFVVKTTLNDVEYDVTDLTNAGSASPEAGIVTIDTSKLNQSFTITANDPAGIIHDVTVYYDTANFKQTQANFASKDIDAIYYFLCSVYRGYNSTGGNLYFNFEEGWGIEEFINEHEDSPEVSLYDHSTYGLMNLFLNSNIFGQHFDDDGMLTDAAGTSYLSGDFALYNLFKVKVEFNGMNVTVAISDNFGSGSKLDHLKYLYDKRNNYYPTEMGIEHALLESAYLDKYLVSAGTYQAYLDGAQEFFDGTAPIDLSLDVSVIGVNYAAGTSQNDVIVSYFRDIMTEAYENAVHGNYNSVTGTSDPEFTVDLNDPEVRVLLTGSDDPITEPGYIGKSILAGQVEKTLSLNYQSISIPNTSRNTALMTPTADHKTHERTDFIPSMAGIDCYGSSNNPFPNLDVRADNMEQMMTMLGYAHAGMSSISITSPIRMTVAQAEVLATALENYGDACTGDAKLLMDAFYIGSIYNVLILRGVYYDVDVGYFHISNDFIDMVNATNTMQDGSNSYIGNLGFSYAGVASAIRASSGLSA